MIVPMLEQKLDFQVILITWTNKYLWELKFNQLCEEKNEEKSKLIIKHLIRCQFN